MTAVTFAKIQRGRSRDCDRRHCERSWMCRYLGQGGRPMEDHRILQLLCCELSFLKVGGYGHALRDGWRPTLMFWDSPVCLNFDSGAPHQPCERCIFFDFVPEAKRDALIPCHHIPLNRNGDTVHALYRRATQEVLDDAVRNWLEAMIERLQREEKWS